MPDITFTLEQIEDAAAEYGGFCIACGEEAYNVEPDARNYECESCGKRQVFGAEEIALMGLVDTSLELGYESDPLPKYDRIGRPVDENDEPIDR